MGSRLFDQVVLFTHDFPFNTGAPTAESYLEGELPLLASRAGEVIIVAHEGFNPDWPLRMSLPSNARAYGIQDRRFFPKSANEARRQRHGYAIPPCMPILSDVFKIGLKKHRLSAAIDFLQLADAKAAALEEMLDQEEIEIGMGETLLYSFWYNEPISMMIALADSIEKKHGRRPLLVSRAHGYDCYSYRSDIGYLPFKEWMGTRLDGVHVCSKDGARYLAKQNPRCAKKYHCSYLGTIDCGLGPWTHHSRMLRPYTLVCCSRAVALKRVDCVIDAVALLKSKGQSIVLYYIGDGPELQSLKAKAEAYNLDEVIFLGALLNKEVLSFYQNTQVDLFVNTSTSEGIPISIMEALSFGVPALVTDVGGEREIISEDLGNGAFLRPDFSIEELVGAIESMMALSYSDAVTMRATARAVWEAKFDVETNVEQFLQSVVQYR